MKVSLVLLGCLLCMTLLVACGAAEPQIVERTVEVPVEVETIREVEVEKEVPVEVERQVTVEVERQVETIKEVEKLVVATPTPVQIPESGRLPGRVDPVGSIISVSSYLGFQGVDTNISQDSATKVYYDEVFDYAIGQNPDGTLTPGFATKWEVSPDQLTWTFTIREGMKFHNGDDITPEDVAWTWNRAVGEDSLGGFALEVGPLLTSAFTVAGNTVSVSTETPQSTLPLFFASASPPRSVVFPQAHFESVGGIDNFREAPVGSGPYKWADRVPGQYIQMEAFDDHYEKNPGYKVLQIWDVAELNTRMAMLKSGNADLITASVRSVDELQAADLQILQSPAANISWIWYNYAWVPGHPFNDKRIREAISIAIDREAIGTGLYAGQTTPACCYWVVEGNIGYPGDVEPHPYDPQRAAQLIQEADFAGAEIEIITFSGDADFVDQPGLSEAVAGYLEAIGLSTFVSVVDGPVLRETFDNAIKTDDEIETIVKDQPPYQIAVRGSDTRLHSYRGSHIYYHSEGRRQMMRLPGILDPLLDKAGSSFDLQDQHDAMADFHRLLNRDFWAGPLLEAGAVFGASDKVGTWTPITGKPYPHNHWTIRP
ncbi:MAG: ABC transporter substrate-binding protein [Chloroflexota bacterium]|nr:ABC transporter substrate-binding protein [Chloroflexota bacterium]